jgi:hypothetical protein
MKPSQGFILSRSVARGTEGWQVFRETKSLVTIFYSVVLNEASLFPTAHRRQIGPW